MNTHSLATIPAQLSDNARTVLAKRYLIKDAAGNSTETPEDMFARVATVIAEVDRRYGATPEEIAATAAEFYALMTQRRFEPNSPTFTGAGRALSLQNRETPQRDARDAWNGGQYSARESESAPRAHRLLQNSFLWRPYDAVLGSSVVRPRNSA